MNIKLLLITMFLPLFLFGANQNKAIDVVKNMVDKQEQIVVMVENYLLSGNGIDLKSAGNKYKVDRLILSKYYNIPMNFFKNLSMEDCYADNTTPEYCSNFGGLSFEVVEKNNQYIGIRFYNNNVVGSNCTFCDNLIFKNLYKNVISGTKVKIQENTNGDILYPFGRNVLDLFIKTDNFYMLYGDSLHIGENEPLDTTKIWIDIRGSKAIEKHYIKKNGKWMDSETSNKEVFYSKKSDLLTLPKIDGIKVTVLSDLGFATQYSYNTAYTIATGCAGITNKLDPNYDAYCGWIKIIKGMDDFNFIINGIDLSNKTSN